MTEDQFRTRTPVWRCPHCDAKFYSREALEDHKKTWENVDPKENE